MRILLFEAVWCKECAVMHSLWRNLKLEMPELNIKHFEIDENKVYCDTFGIFEVPTIIFANEEGKELERVTGLKHRDTIIELIKKYKKL